MLHGAVVHGHRLKARLVRSVTLRQFDGLMMVCVMEMEPIYTILYLNPQQTVQINRSELRYTNCSRNNLMVDDGLMMG